MHGRATRIRENRCAPSIEAARLHRVSLDEPVTTPEDAMDAFGRLLMWAVGLASAAFVGAFFWANWPLLVVFMPL